MPGISSRTNIVFLQVYRTFVEAGRVAYINYGDDYGKLVVIVDFADQGRALIDGENFPRVLYPIKRLTLTKLVVPLNRGSRTGTLLKACKEFGLAEKWAATPVAKKLAMRSTRANLSDWERFKVMRNRKRRSYTVRKLVSKVISKKKAKAPPKKPPPAKAVAPAKKKGKKEKPQ